MYFNMKRFFYELEQYLICIFARASCKYQRIHFLNNFEAKVIDFYKQIEAYIKNGFTYKKNVFSTFNLLAEL